LKNTYDDTKDRTQLRKVTNMRGVPGYPSEILLEYDADGHMIQDEEGRLLDYDALGRLTQVSSAGGRLL
jgi:hypothetical protein